MCLYFSTPTSWVFRKIKKACLKIPPRGRWHGSGILRLTNNIQLLLLFSLFYKIIYFHLPHQAIRHNREAYSIYVCI